MILIYIILAFFAGVRIIQMLQIDTGPLDIFERFRSLVSELVFKTGNLDARYFYWLWYLFNNFESGFNCRLCLSVWVYGLLAFGFYLTGVGLYESLLIWLGLSGIYYMIVKG